MRRGRLVRRRHVSTNLHDAVFEDVSRGVTPAIRAALVELDTVNLAMEFSQRASLMKSVPNFLRGPVRSAVRLAMEEATEFNERRRERGWKLFLLLPRFCFLLAEEGTYTRPSLLTSSRILWKDGG